MRPLFPAIRHRTGERPLDISRGARWDRATQGCCGSHGDTIQRAGVSEEFLVYFFHAGGVLISLERGDLLRNSCAGFLCCHLILINA